MLGGIMKDSGATVFPRPLKKGDKIAIIAPAGPVRPQLVEEAAKVIRERGYMPLIFPTVYKENGQFSGTPEERFNDMKKALLDPEIRAVICARGGYGAVHILDSLSALPLQEDPKWVVGFSDISAIHGLMASKGIASIHGPMALHISRGMEEPENATLFAMLEGEYPTYTFAPDSLNHLGTAQGKLLGGNISVLEGLVNTPYDILQPGTILFIEDVSEEIYKIQRMLYQLKLSGVLPNLKGLIIGQFTEMPKGMNYETAEPMIRDMMADYPDLPVAFNVPVGHIRHNTPMIVSSFSTLEVKPDGVTLKMEEWPD